MRQLWAAALAGSLLAAGAVMAKELPVQSAAPVAKLAIRFSPVYERVAQADAIVIGKVTGLEKKTVAALPFATATEKIAYQIASLKIEKALAGVKGLTNIRVGFVAQNQGQLPPPEQGGGRAIRPALRIRMYQPRLNGGEEGVFFLTKHFKEDYYLMTGYGSVITKQNNTTYDTQLAQVKRCVKLLAKPAAGLKAKDASDRVYTAGMLVARYRMVPPGTTYPPKTEPIDAKQSKLILTVLADADWAKNYQEYRLSPLIVFLQLGLTPHDGWTPPQMFKDYTKEMSAAAKEWIKKNGDTYRIQRIVATKPAKK